MDSNVEIYRQMIRKLAQGADDGKLSWWLDGGGAWIVMTGSYVAVRTEEIKAEIDRRAMAAYESKECIADLIWEARDGD